MKPEDFSRKLLELLGLEDKENEARIEINMTRDYDEHYFRDETEDSVDPVIIETVIEIKVRY